MLNRWIAIAFFTGLTGWSDARQGDLDLNGTLNAADYTLLQNRILGKSPALTGLALIRADVNLDQRIDVADLIFLNRLQESPRVISTHPARGGVGGRLSRVQARFDIAISTASLTEQTFGLFSAGADQLTGTGDDAAIAPAFLEIASGGTEVRFNTAITLPPGLYRARLAPPLAAVDGRRLTAPFVWDFWLMDFDDADRDGMDDADEPALNLNPGQPDTNNNGIPDGAEDFDGDGLSNMHEELMGTSPGDSDSDDDGLPDGREDRDQDGIADSIEFNIGTNPFAPDSDLDGWNDEVETFATSGGDPLNPDRVPSLAGFAGASVRVFLPGTVDTIEIGAVVAPPPLRVFIPGDISAIEIGSVVSQPATRIFIPSPSPELIEQGTWVAAPPLSVKIAP